MPDYHSAYDGKFTSGRGKRRYDDDEPTWSKRVRGRRALPSIETFDATDGLPDGDRWSTWDQCIPTQRGPKPYPGWLVTELAAVDTEVARDQIQLDALQGKVADIAMAAYENGSLSSPTALFTAKK